MTCDQQIQFQGKGENRKDGSCENQPEKNQVHLWGNCPLPLHVYSLEFWFGLFFCAEGKRAVKRRWKSMHAWKNILGKKSPVFITQKFTMFVDFLVQPFDRQINGMRLFSAPGQKEPNKGLPSPSSASASETRIKEYRIMQGASNLFVFPCCGLCLLVLSIACWGVDWCW